MGFFKWCGGGGGGGGGGQAAAWLNWDGDDDDEEEEGGVVEEEGEAAVTARSRLNALTEGMNGLLDDTLPEFIEVVKVYERFRRWGGYAQAQHAQRAQGGHTHTSPCPLLTSPHLSPSPSPLHRHAPLLVPRHVCKPLPSHCTLPSRQMASADFMGGTREWVDCGAGMV